MRILTGWGRRSPPAAGQGMSTGMGLFLIALGCPTQPKIHPP